MSDINPSFDTSLRIPAIQSLSRSIFNIKSGLAPRTECLNIVESHLDIALNHYLEGRTVYAAEAERLRLWAEGREKSPVTAAMEMVPSGAWVTLFSSSVLCAYVILSTLSGGDSSMARVQSVLFAAAYKIKRPSHPFTMRFYQIEDSS